MPISSVSVPNDTAPHVSLHCLISVGVLPSIELIVIARGADRSKTYQQDMCIKVADSVLSLADWHYANGSNQQDLRGWLFTIITLADQLLALCLPLVLRRSVIKKQRKTLAQSRGSFVLMKNENEEVMLALMI